MAKNAYIGARIDEDLKKETEVILKQMGITAGQAINMLFAKVRMEKRFPIELKVPNEKTIKAMWEADNMEGEETTLEDLKNDAKAL